jgi:hypothetical protein
MFSIDNRGHRHKGHSLPVWAGIGFFTGVIGLVIAALIPAKEPA